MEEITIEFVKSEMKELGISRKEICDEFKISKGWLSDLLNPKGRNPLSTWSQKAAFKFFFLYRRRIVGAEKKTWILQKI